MTCIFTQQDANDILSIRLPNFEEDDYIAWQPEKNGIFTVRSAYRPHWAVPWMKRDLKLLVQATIYRRTGVFGTLFRKQMSPKRYIFLHGG